MCFIHSDASSENEDDFVAKNGTRWRRTPGATEASRGQFDQCNHGLTDHSQGFKTAREAFELFISTTMLAVMVKYTNVFAKSKRRYWKDVTVPEMRAFLGVLIAAGRLHMNDVNTSILWNSDDVWAPRFFKLAMSRDRFRDIYNFWRFDDRKTRKRRFRKSKNKLEPVKLIYDGFVNRCIRNYNPGKHLTIDERLCVFLGKYIK